MVSGKIRVLQVTNSLNYGGLERVAIDLCRYLDAAEFEPMVACIKRKGAQAKLLEDAGIPVMVLKKGLFGLSSRATFLDLRRLIRRHGIHVVHTHNTGPLFDVIMARLTSWKFPKIIHTDHTRAHWPDKKRYMVFERLASEFVHAMIAVSAEAKEKLVGFEHIPAARIDIIDNGIAVEQFDRRIDCADELKKDLNLDQFQFVIGLCVMHRKQKGIKHLLSALPAILAEYPSLVCVIGGGGPEREALEALASELCLQEHVRFIGPRNDVERILPTVDIYVLPSEWEGLPLSLLEAMAARRCIVATAVGAVPEALEHGNCGVLIPPENPGALAKAVIGLLQSPERRATLAAEAYRCVNQNYSAAAMASNYAVRYKKILGMI